MSKTNRWKCTVCGYIHEGQEPPAKCPVCGADRSLFVPLEEEQPGLLREIVATFRLHPVAAHFPAGLVPTAAIFLVLSVVLDHSGFEAAAFWLIAVATAMAPIVIGSGLHDWRKAFGGQKAPIFTRKISLAGALFLLGLVAVSLRATDPQLLTGGAARWLYVACLAGMLVCVMLLGHFGAILAARRARQQQPPA